MDTWVVSEGSIIYRQSDRKGYVLPSLDWSFFGATSLWLVVLICIGRPWNRILVSRGTVDVRLLDGNCSGIGGDWNFGARCRGNFIENRGGALGSEVVSLNYDRTGDYDDLRAIEQADEVDGCYSYFRL